MSAGRDVAALRDRLGASRPQLARAVGVSEVSIVRWEAGRGAPHGLVATVLEALALWAEQEPALAMEAVAEESSRALLIGLADARARCATDPFTPPALVRAAAAVDVPPTPARRRR